MSEVPNNQELPADRDRQAAFIADLFRGGASSYVPALPTPREVEQMVTAPVAPAVHNAVVDTLVAAPSIPSAQVIASLVGANAQRRAS